MRNLCILGSTGSIGTQTLEVIRNMENKVKVKALTAYHASEKLLNQVIEFKPDIVVTFEDPSSEWVSNLPANTKYIKGMEGIEIAIESSDMVMNAISGVAGIEPAYITLNKGKILLASNKEAIVCLGDLIKKSKENIIPVDSEHNALFQLIKAYKYENIKKIWLTASGGPFFNKSYEEFKKAKVVEALNHPRWNMGKKITIDSATLFNKGIEIIEAMYLFDFPVDKIDVVVHPQSYVHGIIELEDNSFIMHVSPTDMKIPIMYALTYPCRTSSPFKYVSILELSHIDFYPVDKEKFKSIDICKEVGRKKGAYIPALLGADEEAVNLFLEGKINLPSIANIVEKVLNKVNFPDPGDIKSIKEIIEWAKKEVRNIFSLQKVQI